jgi:hypothetical protein
MAAVFVAAYVFSSTYVMSVTGTTMGAIQFMQHTYIYAFHMLFVGPLLMYVGYTGYSGKPIPLPVYMMLMGLGAVVMAYHASKFIPRVIAM